MRKFTTLGLLCFVPFIATAQESGALRVKVVDGVSGRPVPDVTVVVFDQKRVPDQPAESRSSSSDERGVALFEGLPAGSYRLKVEHSGFGYSRNRIGRDSLQPLVEVLGGGGTVEQVCKLFPPGSISGKVVDAEGLPLRGVKVVAYTLEHLDGETKLREERSSVSGPEGLYRIAGLDSGFYRLRATPSPSTLGKQRESSFYPVGMDAQAAAPVVVLSGQESSGFDFKLLEVSAWPVEGKVSFEEPIASSVIYVERVESLGADKQRVSLNRDLTFRIPALTPGFYRMSALLSAATDDKTPRREAGSLDFTVKDSPVEGLLLPMRSRMVIRGTISAGRGTPLPPNLKITLRPIQTNGISLKPSESRPDGKGEFQFEGVAEGPHFLNIQGLPSGLYVKRMLSGTRDVLRAPFIPAAGESLEIEIAEGSAISGVSLAERDKPVAGAVIVMMPGENIASNTSWKWIEESQSKGQFRKNGIPPGVYRIAAFYSLDMAMLADVAYRRKVWNEGIELSFPERHGAVVQVLVKESPQP